MQNPLKIDFSDALKNDSSDLTLKSFKDNNPLEIDFSGAFDDISPKEKRKRTNLNAIYKTITDLEAGKLTKSTNNAGAVLWTPEIADKFGATKGPKLPPNDNPENRELFTAKFNTKQQGDLATEFIINKIYNKSNGDLETFASIYALGKNPNQLITDREISIKNLYFDKLSQVATQEDLYQTRKRQSDDVASAVVKETLRISNGGELQTDLSNDFIFKPPTESTKEDVAKFGKTLPVTIDMETFLRGPEGNAELYESSVPLKFEGNVLSYLEKPQATEFNPSDYHEIGQKVQRSLNKFQISKTPELTGGDAFRNATQNLLGVDISQKTVPRIVTGFAANAIDIGLGLKEEIDTVADAALLGDTKTLVDVLKQNLDGLAIGLPTILSDTMIALGLNPLPNYNASTKEGAELVAQKQEEFLDNPAYPLIAALGMKSVGRSLKRTPPKVKKALKSIDEKINQYLNEAKTAIKVKNGEINIKDVNPVVASIAKEIKNPQALQLVVTSLSGQALTPSAKTLAGGPARSDLIPISKDTAIGASKALLEKNKRADINKKQLELAREELPKLAETIASTKKLLLEKNISPAKRDSYEKSLQVVLQLFDEHVNTVGNTSSLKFMQGGLGGFKINKKDFELFYEFVKAAKDDVKTKFTNNVILSKFTADRMPEDLIDKNKIKNQEQKDLINFLDETSNANKLHFDKQKFTYQNIKNKILNEDLIKKQFTKFKENFVDVGASVNVALDDAAQKLGLEGSIVATHARIMKDNVLQSSTRAGFVNEKINQNIYQDMTGPELRAFDKLILVANERSIKKYQDDKLPILENELLNTPSQKKKKRDLLKKEIKRINNYKYSGGTKLTNPNSVESILALMPAENAAKLRDKIKLYFDTYKEMNQKLYDAGIIDSDLLEKWNARDYSKKEYIDKIRNQTSSVDLFGRRITVTNNGVTRLSKGDIGYLLNEPRRFLTDYVNQAIGRIDRNNANKAMANLLASKDVDLSEIGFLKKQKDKNFDLDHKEVKYFDNGLQKSFYLKNEVNNGWVTASPMLNTEYTRMLNKISGNHLLKTTATAFNPAFAITNIIRDMGYVTFTQHGVYSNNLLKAYKDMASDMISVFPEVRKGLDSKMVQDYLNEGGTMQLLSTSSRYGDAYAGKNLKSAGKFSLANFGKLSEWSELTTRLAVRKRMIDNGFSPLEATHKAVNMLNFSMGGRKAKMFEIVMPYTNAQIQATRGLFRGLKPYKVIEDGKLKQKSGAVTSLIKSSQIALAQYTITKMWGSNEETSEILDRVPESTRLRNFIIPLGYKIPDQSGLMRDAFIKIPKDQGQQIVGGTIDLLYEIERKGYLDLSLIEGIYKVVSALQPYQVASLNPAITSILGGFLNKNTFFTDIYKGNKNVSPRNQTNNFSEELIFQDIGKTFNVSPAKTEYIAERFIASNNPLTDMAHGSYSILRNNFSENGKAIHDRSLEKSIGVPVLGTRGIRKFPERIIGLADTRDFVTKKQLLEIDKKRKDDRAIGNQYIDSYILRINATDNEKTKNEYRKSLFYWFEDVEKKYGTKERKRLEKRLTVRFKLSNADIAKGVLQNSYGKEPVQKAFTIAQEIVGYKDDPKAQRKIFEEILSVKGYVTKDTKLYYNAMMQSLKFQKNNFGKIYKDPPLFRIK